MNRLERIMKKNGPGIVAFELAGSTKRARQIIESWGPAGLAAARHHLHADFALILSYSVILFLITTRFAPLVGAHTWSWTDAMGQPLGKFSITAGILDVGENLLLLRVLALAETNDDLQPQARIANIFAAIKFGLIFLVIFWILVAACLLVVMAAYRGW